MITIEQLAEKLNGKLWTKGELKRIYLDEGYNTKKMSTKTYVYQNENGDFKVSCHIECPSQAWQWIKSQEDEIKANISRKIENAIAIAQLTLVDFKVTTEHKPELLVYVRFANEEPVWYTESVFEEKFGKYPEDVFEGLPTIQYTPVASAPVAESFQPKPIEPTATPTYGVGCQVKHGKFGIGTVVAEGDTFIEITFGTETKKLLKAFVKLEIVTDAN